MNPDQVTLEYLEQLDAAIALAEQHVHGLVVQLVVARKDVAVLRARQAHAADAYNRQAARPLVDQ